MVKSRNENLRVISSIILMLLLSPLTATFVYADSEEIIDSFRDKEISKFEGTTKIKAILAERVVNGKLLVSQFNAPADASSDQIRKILMDEGKTNGWAYIKGKIYNSGIVLYDSKSIEIDDLIQETTKDETINKRHLDFELTSKMHNHITLNGTASNEELNYKIVLSGNVAQIKEENVLALYSVHPGLENHECGSNITLYQTDQIAIESTNGEIVNSFKGSISSI